MARRLVLILRGIALLLCLLFLGLWVRSRYVSDIAIVSDGACAGPSGGNYYEFVTIPHQFRLTHVHGWIGAQPLRWTRTNALPPFWPVFGERALYSRWLPFG